MAGYLIAFVVGIFIMGALIAQREKLGSVSHETGLKMRPSHSKGRSGSTWLSPS